MPRLTTALLILGAIMAAATTAIAQPGWNECNPNAPRCRVYGFPSPTGKQESHARTQVYHHTHHHHTRTQTR